MPFVGKPHANQENDTYTSQYNNIFVHSIAAIKELDIDHNITKDELKNKEKMINELTAKNEALNPESII